eukprot:scpid64240/ scgid27897/ 
METSVVCISLLVFLIAASATAASDATARSSRDNDVTGKVVESGTTGGVLPAECYHPAGKTCDWYSECLEVVYPCKARGQLDYPLDFAQHYCQQFGDYLHDMSPMGRAWVNAVRLCLQEVLVPLLNRSDSASLSCKNLTRLAFESHTPCYLHPDAQNLTISACTMTCEDLALMVYIVWFRGSALTKEFGLTLQGMLQVAGGCLETKLSCLHINNTGVVTPPPQLHLLATPLHAHDHRTDGVVQSVAYALEQRFGLRERHVMPVSMLDVSATTTTPSSPAGSIPFTVSLLDMQHVRRRVFAKSDAKDGAVERDDRPYALHRLLLEMGAALSHAGGVVLPLDMPGGDRIDVHVKGTVAL